MPVKKKQAKKEDEKKNTQIQNVVVNVGNTPRRRAPRRKKKTATGRKGVSGAPMGIGMPKPVGGIVSSGYSPYEVNQLIRNEVQRLAEAPPTLQQIVAGHKVPLVQDNPRIANTITGEETIRALGPPPPYPSITLGSNVLGQQQSFDNSSQELHFMSPKAVEHAYSQFERASREDTIPTQGVRFY